MALRTILEFPDPRLRTRAQPVTRFDGELSELIRDMLETMYKAPGIGLAATQVDVHQRVIVIDISDERNEPLVLINPEIKPVGEPVVGNEGCLSFPEIYAEISRPGEVEVKALNEKLKLVEFRAGGLLSRAIQHEADHLNGILFIDRMTKKTKEEIREELDTLQKATKAELEAIRKK